MSTTRTTALDELHRSLGATFTEFAGWRMPVRYTSDFEEHRAVRRAAGIFDLSHMGQIEVTGPGAAQALDTAVVSWISRLDAGRAKYTMMCDDAGGIVDDLVVYRVDEAAFLVVANASNHATVLAELRHRTASYDVTLVDRSATDALIAVQGPRSREVLQVVADVPLPQLRYYAIMPARVCGVPAWIARTGYTGEDGFEVYAEHAEAPALWTALLEAGGQLGLKPAGLACRDTLRLEAGMPLYGHELDSSLTPFDAGLGRVVALDKPADFVGRAALEKSRAQPPARTLVGLEVEGRRIPRQSQSVVARHTGERVGVITSGAPSPTLRRPIAMAYVEAPVAAVGTQVAVDIRGSHAPAVVVPLPFYTRPR